MLNAGDSQAGHSAAVDRALPAGEFLEAERITLAGFVDRQQSARYGRHDLGLAAHDPAAGLGRRQAVERQRLAERADNLGWPKLLILEHPDQTCLIVIAASRLKGLPLKIF